MTFVITQPCIGTKDASCVEVCPVNCIHDGGDQFYIDPKECIDCGACVATCPVQAIFAEADVPADQQPFIAKNAQLAQAGPQAAKAPAATHAAGAATAAPAAAPPTATPAPAARPAPAAAPAEATQTAAVAKPFPPEANPQGPAAVAQRRVEATNPPPAQPEAASPPQTANAQGPPATQETNNPAPPKPTAAPAQPALTKATPSPTPRTEEQNVLAASATPRAAAKPSNGDSKEGTGSVGKKSPGPSTWDPSAILTGKPESKSAPSNGHTGTPTEAAKPAPAPAAKAAVPAAKTGDATVQMLESAALALQAAAAAIQSAVQSLRKEAK